LTLCETSAGTTELASMLPASTRVNAIASRAEAIRKGKTKNDKIDAAGLSDGDASVSDSAGPAFRVRS
jgi:hypothetical protein